MNRRTFLQASCAVVAAPLVPPPRETVATTITVNGWGVNGCGFIEPGSLLEMDNEILRVVSVGPVETKRP